eukprot:Nitzschia sp. Nitz4//scaffold11_size288233//166113//168044//NITZ4_000783-RA/size288233-processed-gene-0.170-mRNA-1//1//CDS//3329534101//1608//frame0
MTNQMDYDEIEKSLGISYYMSPSTHGFSAVVKARFSDFLVHEVALDGTVARLTSREIPASLSAVETPQEPENPVAEATDDKGELSWSTLQTQLQDMIKDAAIAEQVMKVLQSHNADEKGEAADIPKFVTLPSLEKPQRKAVHQWVKDTISEHARADTLDGKIRIWHVKFEKEMPNYQMFGPQGGGNNKRKEGGRNQPPPKRSKSSWPAGRPDFLQFVLYKENTDTTTATKELSRKGSKARIGYAGMKDKRGITTQFCTLYRTEPEQIVGQHRTGGGKTQRQGFSVVQVGNFEYVSTEMRLGTLRGNRFDLVLRNVKTEGEGTDRAVLEEAAQAMKKTGFINYFGMQRFGKYQDTHLIGIAVLNLDFRKAIDTLMAPKPDDRPDVAQGRKDWATRFENCEETADKERETAKEVARKMNRFMTAESAAMQSLLRYPQNYRRAFTCIPKTLRMMFLHAVQSLLWNRAASYRVEMNPTSVLAGDLVQKNGSDEVVVVTEEDVTNGNYTIEDVVLPLVGIKSKLPTNATGDKFKELLKEIGISVDMFQKLNDKDLALNGDYRKLLCRPTDFEYEIKEYFDPKQPLLQTDLMKLNGEDIEITPAKEGEQEKVAMLVGFTLPSSAYATVALRELMKKPTSSEYQKDLKLE